MRWQVWTDPDALDDVRWENGPEESCNSEHEEIYRANGTTFHIVRVDFFDHAVGNHRGARCDPEYEHSDLRRNWERLECDLSSSHDHDRRAAHDYWFSPSDTVGKPTKYRASHNPSEGNHGNGDHSIVERQLEVLLKPPNSPDHVSTRRRCEQ